MYDIYLSIGCRSLPNLEDLVQEVPVLTGAAFQEKLLTPSPHRPGFLGLNLPETVARKLLVRLRYARALGEIVPSAYYHPKISKEQALALAEPAIAELQRRRYPDRRLGLLYFAGERAMYFTFDALLEPPLQIEGKGLYTSIDKLDGHIWTPAEFAKREEGLEQVEEEVRRLEKKKRT